MTPHSHSSNLAPRQVHLVPHTHWDREWYHVAPRFRQRLVALVDALIARPDGPFLLDGQAITLRDYLAVRPEQQRALATALRSGLLEAGPWFVLADNLIPSGEAIVRNLQAGRRVLGAFGATAPAVAYCPDTFGHPAALPLIAHGFGLAVAVVWRGAGGTTQPTTDSWWWEAPDGRRVLTHHLPPDGYEFGSALPVAAELAHERWQQLEKLFAARNPLQVALLLNGADHHARQPDLADALAALQRAAGNRAHIRQSSLAEWADALLKAGQTRELPVVRGELRDSYGYTWTLGGTYATRAHQKRRNARLERGLLRDVEPWLALVRLHAGAAVADVRADAQLSMAQLPALLHRAWEDLLTTHPHDTLCGCSTDAVARSMDVQHDAVAEQGKELRTAALSLVLGHDPVAARVSTHFDWRRLVLRNRAPRPRGGLAMVRLAQTLAHAPVGPGSARPMLDDLALCEPQPSLLLSGAPMVSQPLSVRETFARRESPQHYPDNDRIAEHRVLLWVPPVPPLGVDLWNAERWSTPLPAPPIPLTIERSSQRIVVNNGRLTLVIDHAAGVPRASLTVDDRTLHGVLALETQRDEGDTYTASLRGPVTTLSCTHADLLQQGPLRAVVRLHWHAGGGAPIRATTDLVVDVMSPVLQCHVRGENRRRNHRLQLVWHTDVQGGRVWADAAFGPVERRPIVAPADASEAVPDTMPMHRWVMQANPMFGATMFADGLAEASVHDGRLALTLVRSVGELAKPALPERPGRAGWPVATPEAQCLGVFEARSALYLHGPMSDDLLSRVRDLCDDLLLPLVGESGRDISPEVSGRSVGGPALVGEAFELSAMAVAQHDPEAIMLRVVNVTHRHAWGTIHMPANGPWSFVSCRLDETPLTDARHVDRDFNFEAHPREVLTLLVKRLPSKA